VTGAPHQVGEANFLDPAQVWKIDPVTVARFDYLLDVEVAPAHVNQLDL
jgi:hypothetical protein